MREITNTCRQDDTQILHVLLKQFEKMPLKGMDWVCRPAEQDQSQAEKQCVAYFNFREGGRTQGY